jgi:maltooligosyltrehalose trehalohydrolase
MAPPFPWWYPVGAQLHSAGAVFRVWAHTHKTVSLRINDQSHQLTGDASGFFSVDIPGVREGDRYSFFLDGKGPFPDPASRFQPEGPHGPSQIVNPDRFSWTDHSWPGIHLRDQIIYELHIGTFTPTGTFRAAIEQLPHLVELGVTAVEVMPVAEFSGSFGWGYDGVDLFAPTRNYGSPDDFRSFVDAAHALNLGVLLDVVYNHLGPDGNYLSMFSEHYFSRQYHTEWGAAINFHGDHCGPVREFFAANAAYWIREFHIDGLRLDATHSIYDTSKTHILTEIARSARRAAEPRGVIVVAENESQHAQLIRPESQGGFGLDAIWNDDFHHSTFVATTGMREAYFTDYLGSAQELLSCLKYGFLYQGQWYTWQKKRRGTPALDIDPPAFVTYIQNHDQIANSAYGLRLDKLTSYGRYKTITAFLLLAPSTPLLFQGQEFASSAPFRFFADHQTELAELVRKGRAEFLSQWRSLSAGAVKYDDPSDRATFEKCKLDFAERESHSQVYALHRDLLRLRKHEALFSRQDRHCDGAVLNSEAFVVRFFSKDLHDDRLLLINLGAQLYFSPSPVPLLAPALNTEWQILWSSENPQYGGVGTPPLDSNLNWIIPAHAAVVLKPAPRSESKLQS